MRISIEVENKLLDIIKNKIKNTDFKSPEEYIIYILNQVIGVPQPNDVDKEKEEKIRKKLKEMGYIKKK